MGMDSQLIDDGTYFVVEWHGDIADCGGWSRRATLYGGNQTPGRGGKLDATGGAAVPLVRMEKPVVGRRWPPSPSGADRVTAVVTLRARRYTAATAPEHL